MHQWFRYEFNGKTFTGKTIHLVFPIYFLFGPRDSILWVKLNDEDFQSEKSITRGVRVGNSVLLIDSLLHFISSLFTFYASSTRKWHTSFYRWFFLVFCWSVPGNIAHNTLFHAVSSILSSNVQWKKELHNVCNIDNNQFVYV